MTHRPAAAAAALLAALALAGCGGDREPASRAPATSIPASAPGTVTAPPRTTTTPLVAKTPEHLPASVPVKRRAVDDAGAAVVLTRFVDPRPPSSDGARANSGNRLVAATVKLANAAATAATWTTAQFRAVGKFEDLFPAVADPAGFTSVTVAPGASRSATVVFEIPNTERRLRLRVIPQNGKPTDIALRR